MANYNIKLKLIPTENNISQLKGKRKDKYLKDKSQLLGIIKDSLYGFDIIKHNIKKDIFEGVVRQNKEGKELYKDDSDSIEEILKSNYENGADTWMEGNIILTADDDNNKNFVELYIDFIKVKKQDKKKGGKGRKKSKKKKSKKKKSKKKKSKKKN